MGQWRDEIVKFTAAGTCTVMLHYQDKRATTSEQFENCDFVVTSYGTVAADARRCQRATAKGQQHSVCSVFGVVWNRCILDEAHLIKNKATDVARACTAIPALHRWAVTGTPIQNSLQVLCLPGMIGRVLICGRAVTVAVFHAPVFCALVTSKLPALGVIRCSGFVFAVQVPGQ